MVVDGVFWIVVTALFRIQTDHLVTYSADDAAAMAWLNQHAQPGEVLLNDGAADAGIWAPYKTPVSIVLLHTQVFVPKTSGDLEIAVIARDHQKLLQSLRRLRQSIKLTGVYP